MSTTPTPFPRRSQALIVLAFSLLGVSVKTAESHRTRIMKKLGHRDTAGLVRYAIQRGLSTL